MAIQFQPARRIRPFTFGKLAMRSGEPQTDNPYTHPTWRAEWERGWKHEWEVIEVEAGPGLSVGALLEQLRAAGNVT